jgi:hypothetical protein
MSNVEYRPPRILPIGSAVELMSASRTGDHTDVYAWWYVSKPSEYGDYGDYYG